jgi:hypothetical protein
MGSSNHESPPHVFKRSLRPSRHSADFRLSRCVVEARAALPIVSASVFPSRRPLSQTQAALSPTAGRFAFAKSRRQSASLGAPHRNANIRCPGGPRGTPFWFCGVALAARVRSGGSHLRALCRQVAPRGDRDGGCGHQADHPRRTTKARGTRERDGCARSAARSAGSVDVRVSVRAAERRCGTSQEQSGRRLGLRPEFGKTVLRLSKR